jgi:hypothetical protein
VRKEKYTQGAKKRITQRVQRGMHAESAELKIQRVKNRITQSAQSKMHAEGAKGRTREGRRTKKSRRAQEKENAEYR